MNMKSLIQRMTDIENNKTSQLNESVVTECGMAGSMTPPPAPPSMSINLSAQGLGQIQELLGLMKNAGLEQAAVVSQDMMPVRQDMERLRSIVDGPEMEADAAYGDVITDDEETEESFANEPDEEYQDHEYMIHDLSGGINKPKRMYPASQRGDNAMAVENIKIRLQKALAEKKAKPDFLDMDKDGNKKEPMKKAIADKKKKSPVKEVSSKTRHSYTKAANASLDKALASKDKKTVKKRDRGLDLAYDKKIKDLTKKESVKEGVNISPTFIKHLQMTFGDKAQLSRGEMLKVKDLINKSSIEDIKVLMSANIPHVSQMAKLYLRNKTPGGIVNYKEAEVQEAPALSPKFIKHLQMTFGDKAQLSRSEMRKIEDMLEKLDIANIKTLMSANIPHVSQMAKLYLRNKTPGGIVNYKEAEVQTPSHELDDTARKATNIAQMIKRKINSGEKMDDMDYNQMAELGHVLSRFGTNFGPQSMKDVFNHMKQYTDDRNEYGTGYPEFNVDRFKELLAMAK